MNSALSSTTLNLKYLLLKFAVQLTGKFKIFSLFVAVAFFFFNPIPKSFLQKIQLIPFLSKLIMINHLSKIKLTKMIAFSNNNSLKTLLDKHRFLKLSIHHFPKDLTWFCTGKLSIVTNHAEPVLQPDFLKRFLFYKTVRFAKEKLHSWYSKRHANKAAIFPQQKNLIELSLVWFGRYTEVKFFVENIRLPEKAIMRDDIALPHQKLIIQKVLLKIQNTINIEQFYQNCLHIRYRIKLHSNAYFFQFQEQLIQIPKNEHKKQILNTKY